MCLFHYTLCCRTGTTAEHGNNVPTRVPIPLMPTNTRAAALSNNSQRTAHGRGRGRVAFQQQQPQQQRQQQQQNAPQRGVDDPRSLAAEIHQAAAGIPTDSGVANAPMLSNPQGKQQQPLLNRQATHVSRNHFALVSLNPAHARPFLPVHVLDAAKEPV